MPDRDDVSSIYKNDNNVTELSSDGLYDPKKLLNDLKIKNVNRIVIGLLNINSLRNKFEALKEIINENIDILVITETKIDTSFPTQQFRMDGYNVPFRLDRTTDGGGILIYTKQHVPCKSLKNYCEANDFEGIFFELNLRKSK